jgi:site-specific DNA recombinase
LAIASKPETVQATATAVIYLRVSSLGQVNTAHDPEGYSIPAQRAAALRHAERLDANVIAEFVEYGRSGTSTQRDALQQLLAELPKLKPTYVIIYDLSRLARDDFDALWLLSEIEKHGAKLESTLERIDDSPAGKLLYTVMAGVNAFRSRGDAVKVKSGLERKFLAGGHMGPAPIGYSNAHEVVGDREVAVVVPDPERRELVQMAFELFATGDYSITTLVDVLEDAGLRYRSTPKKPGKPMNRSMVHRMLKNDFYIGIVTLKGAKRDGIHQPIIEREVFERVQNVLAAHRASGDRAHKHSHYLKGSLYCPCGCRLGYGRHKGASGGMYEYFSCLSRIRRRGSCQAPYIPVHKVEEAVERMNARIVLTSQEQEAITKAVREHAETKALVAKKEADRHNRRLRELSQQQQKLVQLHYQQAVSIEVLKAEQQRIETERSQAHRWSKAAVADVHDVMAALKVALELVDEGKLPYAAANEFCRRLINQALYEKIIVESTDKADGEPTPLYAQLIPLARHLGQEAAASAADAPETAAGGPKDNADPVFRGLRSYKDKMAEREGFEPSNEVNPRYAISSRARSTAPAPLQVWRATSIRKATTPRAGALIGWRRCCSRQARLSARTWDC